MPSPRLFDSTALTPPPEPRVEAMTSNRVLTPEERQAEAERVHRQSMEHYFDSLRRQLLWMTPYSGPPRSFRE
jgi:hypothetical protein